MADIEKKEIAKWVAAIVVVPLYIVGLSLVIHSSVMPHTGVYISITVLIFGSTLMAALLHTLFPKENLDKPDFWGMFVGSFFLVCIFMFLTKEGREVWSYAELWSTLFKDSVYTSSLVGVLVTYLVLLKR